MLKILIGLYFFVILTLPLSVLAQEDTSVERSFSVQNDYTLPTQYTDLVVPTPPTLFQQVQDLLTKITTLFGFTPKNKEQFSAEVEARGQVFLYDNFATSSASASADVIEQTAKTAGGESGTLTTHLPDDIKSETDTTCTGAQSFDDAWFPKELSIVSTDCAQ